VTSDDRQPVVVTVELDPTQMTGFLASAKHSVSQLRAEYARLGLTPMIGDVVNWMVQP